MPKIPTKKPAPKVDVSKAIKSVVFEAIPEATLKETGMAMVLAGLAEQHGLAIPDIVGQFPNKLLEAGLPDKLPVWVVRLAIRLDRDARDAMLWRFKDRPLTDPRPEKTWAEVKKLSAGEVLPQAPKPVVVGAATPPSKPKPAVVPETKTFSIFD